VISSGGGPRPCRACQTTICHKKRTLAALSARALNMLAARFPSQNIVANAPQWAQTAMTNPPPRWCVEAPPRPTAPRTRYDALPPTSSFADVRAPSSDVRTPGTSALAPAGRPLTQPFPDQPDVWAPTPTDRVAAYGAFIDSDGGGGATTTPLARCAWSQGPNTSTPHAGGYDAAAVPVSVLVWPAWAGLATEAETTFAGFAPSHPSYNYAQDFPQQTQASPHQLLLPPSACAPPRSVPPIAFPQSLVEQPLLSTLAHSCPSAAFNALASDPPLPVPPMAVPPLLDYPPAIVLRQHAAAVDPATAPPAIMNTLVEPVPAPDIGYPAPAAEAHAPYGGALPGAEPHHFAYTEAAASPEATYYEPARLQDVYHGPAVVEAGLTVHAPVPQPIAASTRVGLGNDLLPVFAQTGPVEDVAYEPPRSIELPVVPAVAGVPTALSELFRIDGGSDGGSGHESDSSASSSARRKKRPRHRTQSVPSDRSSPTTDQPWSAAGSRPSTASTSDAASDLAPSSSKRAGRRTKQMHPCDKCHKSFDRPSTLEKHQEVHERLRRESPDSFGCRPLWMFTPSRRVYVHLVRLPLWCSVQPEPASNALQDAAALTRRAGGGGGGRCLGGPFRCHRGPVSEGQGRRPRAAAPRRRGGGR
jgi:hypothetical protein